MSFFQWKDSFSIGNKEIDQQHQTFVEYINDCYLSITADKKSQNALLIISKLNDYAAKHFRFEEDLMKAHSYPKYEHHVRQHKFFMDQVSKLKTITGQDSDVAIKGIFSFMRDWLLNHILEEDKAIAAYIK